MLSHVAIKNFKSIGEPGIDLELKPLTILVGPNGSGKSSILEAVYFSCGGINPGGPQYVIGDYERDPKREPVVEVTLADGTVFKASAPSHLNTKIRTVDGWLDCRSDKGYGLFGQLLSPLMSTVFFVSVLRGGMPGWVPPTDRAPVSPGPRGEDLILILNRLNEPENIDNKRKVERWAGEFGVKDLWSGARGGLVTALYRDMGALLGVSSAGYGARQILTIIANLFYCPSGSVFLIEEPEISLHPEAQVKLVEMFAEAIKEDKQIILTTHSSLLVMALNRPIGKEDLSSDQVAIYDVIKGADGTQVARLELTDEGYIKGWIPSFKKVEQELMGEWVDSLPPALTPDD